MEDAIYHWCRNTKTADASERQPMPKLLLLTRCLDLPLTRGLDLLLLLLTRG